MKYFHILAIRVCSAGKGMAVFKPITLGWGLVIIKNWFRIGSRLTDKNFNNKRLKRYSSIGSQSLQNLL